MSLKNRFFSGKNLLFKLGIALLIFYNVTFIGPNVAIAQVKDGEGAQNAGKDAVTSLVGEIRKEMNALSMELTLTGQAYEYLKGQHEQLKGNFDLVNKELEEKNAQSRKDKAYYDQQLQDLGAEIAEKEKQINTLNETFRQNSALLMKQSEQIKTSLQKTETENTRLSANNRDYEQKIKNFELQLQEQKDKIKELQKYKSDAEKLEQYRMQVKESGEKLKEAKNEIKALNEKIKEMNTAFETQISEKEDRVQKIKGQHAEALQETDRFQEKAKGYEVQILERDGKIETLRNAMRESEGLLEQQQAKNEQLTQQLKAQNVKILEDTNLYTSKIKSYESQIQNKDKKIAELEQSRNQTDDTLKAKLADTEKQLQKLQAQYAKVLDQEKALNVLIADYEDKLMLKGKELELVKKGSEIAEKKLQDELARVRNQVTEQQKEAEKQLDKVKSGYAEIVRDKDKLTQENRQLLMEKAELENAFTAEKKVSIEIKDDFKTLIEEKDYLKFEVKKLSGKAEELDKKLKQAEDENKKITNANEAYVQKIKSLEKNLADSGKKNTLLEQVSQDKDRSREYEVLRRTKKLANDLEKSKKEIKELEHKNSVFIKEKEQYIAQVNDLKDRCTILEDKLNGEKKEREHLAQQIKLFSIKERDLLKKDAQQIKLLSSYSNYIDERDNKIRKLAEENKQLNFVIKTAPERIAVLESETDELRRQNATLHYNLGVFHTQRQEYMMAIAEFEQALKFNPNDAGTHYNLGVIYSQYIVDKIKAMTHFKHYIALAPDDKDSQRAKEYILIWGNKDDWR